MLKNRVSVSSLSKNRWIKRLLPAWSRSGSWADAASESESDPGSVSGPVSSEPVGTDGATTVSSEPVGTDGATTVSSEPVGTDGATAVSSEPDSESSETEASSEPVVSVVSSGPVSSEPALKHELVQQLYEVIDPELGVNIVDLGLVYAINIDNGQASVRFTTTTPGCPMRRYLQQQVEKAVSSLPAIDDYEVEMVMEPAWSVEMIKDGVEFFSVPPPPRQLDPE